MASADGTPLSTLNRNRLAAVTPNSNGQRDSGTRVSRATAMGVAGQISTGPCGSGYSDIATKDTAINRIV